VLRASLNDNVGVAVRVQSGANSFYYAFRYSPSATVFAGEVIAGNGTDWDAGQAGFAVGDTIELAIDSAVTTTVYLKKNGTTVATYTSKSALSGGRPGVCSYSNIGTFGLDSWEGDNMPGGPPSSTRRMLLWVG
jgi:hypothetical protein